MKTKIPSDLFFLFLSVNMKTPIVKFVQNIVLFLYRLMSKHCNHKSVMYLILCLQNKDIFYSSKCIFM